jgi:hypothetical protein
MDQDSIKLGRKLLQCYTESGWFNMCHVIDIFNQSELKIGCAELDPMPNIHGIISEFNATIRASIVIVHLCRIPILSNKDMEGTLERDGAVPLLQIFNWNCVSVRSSC